MDFNFDRQTWRITYVFENFYLIMNGADIEKIAIFIWWVLKNIMLGRNHAIKKWIFLET